MFETILVPLDGSLFAEEALGRAEGIARSCNATIELLRVHKPYTGDADHGKWENVIRHEERLYLERVAKRVEEHLERPTPRTLVNGEPAEGICEHAARHDNALVVMATHGRTGFSRAWIGSCADAVARRSPLPVLLVRAHEGEHAAPVPGHPLPYRRIVIALDGSSFAEEVLGAAVAIAALCDCELHLVTIVVPAPQIQPPALGPAPMVMPNIDMEGWLNQSHEYLDGIAEGLRAEGRVRSVTTEVTLNERTAAAILASVRGDGSDLVALASHGRGASRLVLGSVADKILRASSSDVLIVRPMRD